MIKILFVCYGNICRSPMAEFIMKDLAKKVGIGERLEIASAATSADEIGNPVYPYARRKLSDLGIECAGKRARRLTRSDGYEYNLLIGMDKENIRDMRRICGEEAARKIHLLLEYADRPGEEVADPWYTRDFDIACSDIIAGCKGLAEKIKSGAVIAAEN